MTKCEFKNCKRDGFSVSIVCYDEEGNFEDVLLCKKHTLMLVPKEVRDFYSSNTKFKQKIDFDKEIGRLESVLEYLKIQRNSKGEVREDERF